MIEQAFNLETVIQGQAVARLNALAFVFLPLSFVAVSPYHKHYSMYVIAIVPDKESQGLFGITTFTVSPH